MTYHVTDLGRTIQRLRSDWAEASNPKRQTMLDSNLICKSCGRDFGGEEDLSAGDDCPATDDCPSHWEEVGLEHPDHPHQTEYENGDRFLGGAMAAE